MRHVMRVWALLPVVSGFLAAQSGSGSISGTVVDATATRAVAGAFVTAKYTGLPPLARTVKTGADGKFQLTGLPAGSYSVCVQMPGGGYLDPCQWLAAPMPGRASSAATLTLKSGQQVAGHVVRVQTGSLLLAHVNDPGRQLAQKTRDGRDPHLLIGVWGQDGFHPMRQASVDGSGATYLLTVPADALLRFAIASRNLTLADEAGKPLPAAGAAQDFQQRAGDANPKSFIFTITGVKP